MKLACSNCSSIFNFDDSFMYDLKLLSQTKDKAPKCTSCNSPINTDALPELFQGDEKNFLRGEALNKKVVGNLKKLYPMPHVTYKARKLINSSNASFLEIGNILKTDPALAGRILKVANSAYYRMSGEISSIQHAATMLGGDTLIQVITLVSNSKMLGKSLSGYDINSGDLWKHAITTAVCANILSIKRSPEDEEDSFFAGLMHDSGKIILDSYIVERQEIFNRYLSKSKSPFQKAESLILGFNHAHTGYELCLKWNLPKRLAGAIKHHHNPSATGDNKLAYVLNIANYMAKPLNNNPDENMDQIKLSLKYLGFSESDMDALKEEAYNAVEALEEDTY